jgi:hypothetical protein
MLVGKLSLSLSLPSDKPWQSQPSCFRHLASASIAALPVGSRAYWCGSSWQEEARRRRQHWHPRSRRAVAAKEERLEERAAWAPEADPGPEAREVERRPWRAKGQRLGPVASWDGNWAAGRRAAESASAAGTAGRLAAAAAAIRSWAAGLALGGVAAAQPYWAGRRRETPCAAARCDAYRPGKDGYCSRHPG